MRTGELRRRPAVIQRRQQPHNGPWGTGAVAGQSARPRASGALVDSTTVPTEVRAQPSHMDLVHQRVWEVGWANVALDLCGVLVREWLAGARWGLSPVLYR